MTQQTIYKNTNNGNEYRIKVETIETLPELAEKYPTAKNVCYGWGRIVDTGMPDFDVKFPLKVLHDIWHNINNKLPPGTYMFAAKNRRILNIYHKRWLANPNWQYLEGGILMMHPYIILKKIDIDN